MTTIESPHRVEDRISELYSMLDGHTLNGNSAALKNLRKKAIEAFAAQGLPTRKTEAWKYTPVEKKLSVDHTVYHENRPLPLSKEEAHAFLVPGIDAYLAVTVNGKYIAELSNIEGLPNGTVFTPIDQASGSLGDLLVSRLDTQSDSSKSPFVALNTAFLKDGLVLHVPAKVHVDKPIYVLHLFDTDAHTIVQPRMLCVAERESEVTLIEQYVSLNEASHFINVVSEWAVSQQATFKHYQIQDLNTASTAVFNQYAYQEQHSYFATHTSTLKGGLIRNNLEIVPDAEECESHLLGFLLGSGTMHVDNHTLVDHKKPNCFSNELYKNILDDQSTGVFNGKVFVHQDAQKINAYQSNKSITLTNKARMYSKPELEIYADDVRCSHGATTGQLDAEALFYLRSRGLSQKQARSILLKAFAHDVIDAIEFEPLRDYVDSRLLESL
ncbi:MAG: Fe-S cluster assembly protein SufD [Rhodothermaceae bacterium]|nr:Fe-S cluster assembly protein SufD [Rhodothermaceae bacterium]